MVPDCAACAVIPGALLPPGERRLAAALIVRAAPRQSRRLPVSYSSSVAELPEILLLQIVVVAVCVHASNEALDAASKRRIDERFGSKRIEEKSLPCRMGRMGRAGLTPRALRKTKRHLSLNGCSDGWDGWDG
jgi:hypothetical protein